MLDKVKSALRLTTNDFDAELELLIDAALLDLGIAGVDNREETDPLITLAVTTYCKIHFGFPEADEYDRLSGSYDMQKAQLGMASGYTTYAAEE